MAETVPVHYEPWWQPCGIYALIEDKETMVGFAMCRR